ncbi:hypothetical protein EA26_19260 [Vibrio navarrensis]|uniref:Uncharacterized protein n=1 Tax=Vibrio navarrensis TaxID=29495 RepID=A0A099LPV4_9VIBR|nr:hypothetical protein EA26_19260 [Vibrio navarrensis]
MSLMFYSLLMVLVGDNGFNLRSEWLFKGGLILFGYFYFFRFSTVFCKKNVRSMCNGSRSHCRFETSDVPCICIPVNSMIKQWCVNIFSTFDKASHIFIAIIGRGKQRNSILL